MTDWLDVALAVGQREREVEDEEAGGAGQDGGLTSMTHGLLVGVLGSPMADLNWFSSFSSLDCVIWQGLMSVIS